MLVSAEWTDRENKRLRRVLRDAKLKLSSACIEDIDYSPKREIDRAQLRQLATCRWVAEHQNVIITGMTGTGKTYVACALAHHACRKDTERSIDERPGSSPSSPSRAPMAATLAC